MNIIHIYSHNLELFNSAVQGTQCHINGSDDIDRLTHSLVRYNLRDVMGLIVYPGQRLTKKCLKLIKSFDELFEFGHLPVIVICDDAEELAAKGIIKVVNSRLFVVNSGEGTVSDVDVDRIFSTIAILAGNVYDLTPLGRRYKQSMFSAADDKVALSKDLKEFLVSIGIEVGTYEGDTGAPES